MMVSVTTEHTFAKEGGCMDEYIKEINLMCNKLNKDDFQFIRRIYTLLRCYLDEKEGKGF